MQIWTKIIDSKSIHPQAVSVLSSGTSMFLDIETTGLSPKYHHCYLIGCCFSENGQILLRQFFCENATEESNMLKNFCSFFLCFHQIITFNGRHFDLPFLEKRCALHNLNVSFTSVSHLDIYRECKSLKKTLGLLSCRQKAIEEFLGISREDLLSGNDLISVYLSYEKDHSPEKLRLLKLHNFEDVLGMTALLPILSYKSIPQNVQVNNMIPQIDVPDPQILVFGTIGTHLPRPLRLRSAFCYCILEDHTFRFSVQLSKGPLKLFIRDYKNYDYLTEEKRIVPKSLSRYVDASRKVPATASTCFLEQDGFFLPITDQLDLSSELHQFRHSYSQKQSFLLWNDVTSDPSFLTAYITAFLQPFF